MRFGQIILAYFVIGAVMFGGGAITFDEAGVGQFFLDIEDDGGVQPSDEAQGILGDLGNAISQLVNVALGGIQLVFNLIVGMLGFLNWPVGVLISNNAPPIAVILLGGSFQVAFYASVIRVVRTSA